MQATDQPHPKARVPRGTKFAGELHVALGGLAGSMSTHLASILAKETKGFTAKEIGRVVARAMPQVLETEFKRELLASEPGARKRRVLLAHVLTGVDAREIIAEEPAVPLGNVGEAVAPDSADEEDVLTSEQASMLLHMSRTHVNSLLDAGALGPVTRTVGGHRRVSRAAVLAYKQQSKKRQAKGLEAMAQASQRLGLYEGELDGIPRKKKR